MADFVPAEAFPPGEFLKDELEERGWTQDEFARLIGRPPRLVSEIIGGKRGITPEVAIRFSAALGTSAQFWMNLETAYRLYELSRSDPAPERIAREAALRETFPVREMVKRGWVKESADAAVLEARVFRFYGGIKSVSEARQFPYAARRTGRGTSLSPVQEAWLYRVKQIAEGTAAGPYVERALRELPDRLSALRSAPEEARQVPRLLAKCGVRFVVVEPMPASKIDGACFWLSEHKPVIGMSLRVDRIDNFWFVLRHEIEHLLRRDGGVIIDSELYDVARAPEPSPEEVAANSAASEFAVPAAELDLFLARVGPAMSEERVVQFAERLGVHPGLVVGQLQWRLQRFNFLRKYLVRVRDIVIPEAMTDGYGSQLLEAVK